MTSRWTRRTKTTTTAVTTITGTTTTRKTTGRTAALDDLMQEAYLAMLRAVRLWRPDGGTGCLGIVSAIVIMILLLSLLL